MNLDTLALQNKDQFGIMKANQNSFLSDGRPIFYYNVFGAELAIWLEMLKIYFRDIEFDNQA